VIRQGLAPQPRALRLVSLALAATQPWLRVEGVSKAYGARVAVDDVSFTISRGEPIGLLGPNGAGKTTLLHMIAGVLPPDSGRIDLGGQGIAFERARIGFAPQSLALYPQLSADENLAFFGRLYGLDRQRLRERIQSALELTGLVARRSERVATLSGGMQRRLNLACAIVHEPDLLLLDEPTTGVDPESRQRILDCLAELEAGGLTLVISTHYLEEAEQLCDRIAIFDQGRMVAFDTVTALIARHSGARPAPPRVSGRRVARARNVARDDLHGVLLALTRTGELAGE
jgi:ABC-2 type transport system ATP-binding protein